jgi:hypothetical protein
MLEVALLPLSPTVEPAVLALNNAHAAELSWLDGDRLTFLLRQAFHARRIGEVDGFLLAFDHRSNRLRRPDWTRYSRLRGQPRSAESGLGRLPRCAGLYRNGPGCDPSR